MALDLYLRSSTIDVPLRPSSIASFIRCPYQYYLTTVLGRKQPPAAATTVGSALHASAEHGYQSLIDIGKLPDLEDIKHKAETSFTTFECEQLEKGIELAYQEDDNRDNCLFQLEAGVEAYYADVLKPTSDGFMECPVAIEKRYAIPINHRFFTEIGGTLDIVYEKSIADIKFTKRASNVAHYTLQQSTYAWLRQASGDTVEHLYIHNVVKPQKVKGSEVIITELPIQIAYAQYWIEKILETVNVYEANKENIVNPDSLFRCSSPTDNYLCTPKWCGFWSECPGVAGLRNEVEEERLCLKM